MKQKPGWRWPERSRKAHFFGEDGRSLCGKWLFFGPLLGTQTIGMKAGPDDCAECYRRAWKVIGATTEHPVP